MKTIKLHQDFVIGLNQIVNSINQNKHNKNGSVTIGVNKFYKQLSPLALEVLFNIPVDIAKNGCVEFHNKFSKNINKQKR